MNAVKSPDFWCSQCERKLQGVILERERDPMGEWVVVNYLCPTCDSEVEEYDSQNTDLCISLQSLDVS
jgi:transcription initiation factor IIE alpha subunit